MADTVAVLVAKLEADTAHFDRNMKSATTTLKRFAGPAAIGAAALAVGKFAASSVQSAARLAESMNAVEVVFGSAAGKVKAFADTSIDSVGLAASTVNEAAVVLGSALQNAGLSADEAADKTLMLTKRAADMASVFNTDVSQALGAMQSALRGESNPIERFGVSMAMAAVEAKAMAMGYDKVGGSFTNAALTAARMALIMEQTEKVAGDYANTADSVANQQKRLTERWEQAKAEIGEGLLPAASALLGVAEDLIPTIVTLGESFAKHTEDIVAWVELLSMLGVDGSAKKQLDNLSKADLLKVSFWGNLLKGPQGMLGAANDLVGVWAEHRHAVEDSEAALRKHNDVMDEGRHAGAGLRHGVEELAETMGGFLVRRSRAMLASVEATMTGVSDAMKTQAADAAGWKERTDRAVAGVVSIFEKGPAQIKVSLKTWQANLDAQKKDSERWAAAVGDLAALGFTNVAHEIAAAGPGARAAGEAFLADLGAAAEAEAAIQAAEASQAWVELMVANLTGEVQSNISAFIGVGKTIGELVSYGFSPDFLQGFGFTPFAGVSPPQLTLSGGFSDSRSNPVTNNYDININMSAGTPTQMVRDLESELRRRRLEVTD